MHAIVMVHKMQRLALAAGPAGANLGPAGALLAQPTPAATAASKPVSVVVETADEKSADSSNGAEAAPGDWIPLIHK